MKFNMCENFWGEYHFGIYRSIAILALHKGQNRTSSNFSKSFSVHF